MSKELTAGKVKIYVEADEAAMGKRTADMIAVELKKAASAKKTPVLWLMAAPSGFAFNKAFVELCAADEGLKALMPATHFFQFDDYPVARTDPKFPITFRALLEDYFFKPLEKVCGRLANVHLMELTGGSGDDEVAADYVKLLLKFLDDRDSYVVQIKGIGMDGHWGFHGADTPLDREPGIIKVRMKGQNIHQQKIDWPQYFKTDEDVPKFAYSCTVSLFLKADCIVDNVPQAAKEFSVLASYGNDAILNEVPSSALKAHPHAAAVLTENSARALVEFRELAGKTGMKKITPAMHERLKALWKEPGRPDVERENTAAMDAVLGKLGFI